MKRDIIGEQTKIWGVGIVFSIQEAHMNSKLSTSNAIIIGSMLFGLFFGAGNLIFPVHMGQEAGANWISANIGFLITAIGIPFLGVVAIGYSGSNGLQDLASRVHPYYAKFFTFLLYIAIGPAFAIPRCATVSYQIGASSYFGESSQTIALAVFSAIFFMVALLFSLKPSKLMDYIGKGLNPLFLFFLALLVIAVVINPMGNPSTAAVSGAYKDISFFKGLTEGYNTMDGLASLAFGILVINAIKNVGIEKPRDIARGVLKAGVVVLILMSAIYTLLVYTGADSLGVLQVSKNGGIALGEITKHYFSEYGALLLGIIVTLACLKTTIGLITACSETFEELFSQSLSYRNYVYVFTVISFLVANLGLTQIIELSIPALMFLYPLAISLILVTLVGLLFNQRRAIYILPTICAGICAIGDFLAATPKSVQALGWVQNLLSVFKQLPYFDLGMSWVVPTLIGLGISIIYCLAVKEKNSFTGYM